MRAVGEILLGEWELLNQFMRCLAHAVQKKVWLSAIFSAIHTRLTKLLLTLFSKALAAVSCSSTGPMLGGVDWCIFVTGKPRRAWVVVHGTVHCAGWVGGGRGLFDVGFVLTCDVT